MTDGQCLIDFLYEDSDLVVISKAAGILTVPGRYGDEPSIRGILEMRLGEIWVVHRLDRDTSGVMVFAKNAAAHRELSMEFEAQRVVKLYHAVLAGVVEKDVAVDLPLAISGEGKVSPSPDGKPSLTVIKVLRRFRAATLVECNLVTGRQHQIRAHCAAIGHPLLVDDVYGNAAAFYLSSLKRHYRNRETERPVLQRLSMHSHSIAFRHPSHGDERTHIAPYPKDFKSLVKILDKYAATP